MNAPPAQAAPPVPAPLAPVPAGRFDLPSLLAHRRWVRRTTPFPHIVAQNVFAADFYARMHEQFLAAERGRPELFGRTMPGYDASAADLRHHAGGPLGVFLTRAWHDLMAGLWDVRATGDVAATIHHHDPGSSSGWPHNDLSPGWFPGAPPAPDEVRLTDDALVDYKHGPRDPSVDPGRRSIRAVSLLFYVGNPAWSPDDGGQTALFASCADASSSGPAATVAPINNSLVMFECTPVSWHTFLTNRQPRNSVVMWIHRPWQDAVDRWGEQSIVHWH